MLVTGTDALAIAVAIAVCRDEAWAAAMALALLLLALATAVATLWAVACVHRGSVCQHCLHLVREQRRECMGKSTSRIIHTDYTCMQLSAGMQITCSKT